MVQLLPEAKQTSWQVFNLSEQAVSELKNSEPTVTGVIGQSDNAGCDHSPDLLICLALRARVGKCS